METQTAKETTNPDESKVKDVKWREVTGIEAADTSLTIVVPIRNETKLLPQLFNQISTTLNLPASGKLNIVFATNNCTDGSDRLVNTILENTFQNPLPLDDELKTKLTNYDSGLDIDTNMYQDGENKYWHINTKTGGKANVLTLANILAVTTQSPFTICIDADQRFDPDAIAYLYKELYNAYKSNSKKVVMTGVGYNSMNTKGANPLVQLYNKLRKPPGKFMRGALMGWQSEWLSRELGEIPAVACEDYALGELTETAGYEWDVVPDAKTYGQSSNRINEHYSKSVRYALGTLQMIEKYPHMRDAKHSRRRYYDARYNFESVMRKIIKDPVSSPFTVARGVLEYIAGQKAKKMFRANPRNTTWKVAESTRE